MSYSPNLTYFLDRLQGFSTNIFRLETNGSDTATANKIIRFSLPSNALLNMRSFSLHFNAKCNDGNGARLPAKIDSLIERVEVTAGGIQLSQGLNLYNVLRHVKDSLLGDKTNSVCGHPDIIRTISPVDGKGYVDADDLNPAILSGTNGERYPSTHKQAQFTVDHWEGFLGTCEPKILDAAILPDLVISIYLADNNVLTSSAGIALDGTGASDITDVGAAGATYELNNIHATIESIGLADSVYDNMVSSMIAQKGYVEIPFKQYFSFNNTHQGSTRFSLATQSLDRVWVAFRDSAYATQKAPVRVKGYKLKGAFTSTATVADTTAAGTITQDIGKSEYLGLLDTEKEKYVGAYYNFVEPATSSKNTYQLQLNGAYYPQFAATAEEMYTISKNSTLGSYSEQFKSLQQYKNNYFVMCSRLNMPESEFSRTASGLDTRSVSLNGYFNTFNTTGSPNVVIFCECTSTIRVGQGRMIEVLT
tara:strand:- start:1567 stop:2997 length:1431 start_codon:yes stop_codon:yes gene_type:complete